MPECGSALEVQPVRGFVQRSEVCQEIYSQKKTGVTHGQLIHRDEAGRTCHWCAKRVPDCMVLLKRCAMRT